MRKTAVLNLQKQKGVSLLEMILVFALASSFLYITINLYYQYRAQLSQTQLLANVDQLFQAMEKYYQANCRVRLDMNNNPVSPGALDPINNPSNPKTLSVVSDLLNNGYLSGWRPANLLVDGTPTEKGYYVQFNRVTPDQTMNVYACTGVNDPGYPIGSRSGSLTSCNSPISTTAGQTTPLDGNAINNTLYSSPQPNSGASHVVMWVMQVAVKLLNPTSALQTQYMLQMNASCVSTAANSNGPVTACNPSSPPAANGYLVWQRAVTFVSNNTSDFWLSQPIIKQFNMQYTNDSMQLLSGGIQKNNNSVDTPVASSSDYYLCGE